MDYRELLSRSQVAACLGVSVATVAKFQKSGRLCAIRLGHRTVRYERSEVERFIMENSCASKYGM
ncbi:MAG: helix-turn-helix domain-containing protein [Opitutales bacterium]|nr:helix-turn-helix domain-containing protein [Opitutales bacterium]